MRTSAVFHKSFIRLVRHLHYLVALLLVTCQPASQDAVNKTTGPVVKTILESMHDPMEADGIIEASSGIAENSVITEFRFNKAGQLTSKSRFSNLGNLEWKVQLDYDRKGNNIKRTVADARGKILSETIRKFDDANRLMASSTSDREGGLLADQTVSFQEDGFRTITSRKMVNGHLIRSFVITFDNQGRNIENDYYTEGSFDAADIAPRDINGDRVLSSYQIRSEGSWKALTSVSDRDDETGVYPATQKLQYQELYHYDKQGFLEEAVHHYPANGVQRFTRYKHDSTGLVTEAVHLDNNLMISSRTSYQYDDHQNVVKVNTYGIMGNLQESEVHVYRYDDNGNWTRNILYLNGKVISVVKRQVEYF